MPRILIVTAVEAERAAVARELPTGQHPGSRQGAPLGATPEERPEPTEHGVADVIAAGVGPAAAAARTATALANAAAAGDPYGLVVSAGIAGGFGQPLGGVVVATAIIAADLGAETPPTPETATPGAGTPGAGTPVAGTPEAGTPEAGTPETGTPVAGTPGFTPVSSLGFGTSEHRPPSALVRTVAEAVGAAPGPVLTVSTTTGTARRARELASRHPGAVAEAMEGFGVAEAAATYGVPALELRTVSNEVGPRDRAAWRVPEALAALGTACAAALPVLRTWTP